MSREQELEREVAQLRAELEQCRDTVRAVIAGEVDAVTTVPGGEPTLLRQAQDALRDSETRLRAIFDGALDAMIIADDQGRYVDANPAAVALFGVSREDLLGRTAADFTDPMDFATVWRQFLDSGRAEGEFPLRRPDGEERVLEFRAAAHIGPGLHLSVMRDVTERRRLEEQLRQSHRLESIGRLAGGIAHDFNNMLSAITGFASFLQEDIPEADPKREDVEEILRASERAARLVRQLLAFSRKQLLNPSVVSVARLLTDVERMTRRVLREDIELVSTHDAGDERVHVDAAEVEQVLMNLVLNARDAMPEGGTITIDTGARDVDPDAAQTLDGLLPGSYVVISVRDTGVGMSEAVLEHVFEPFFSTKAQGKGTGLGLSTAYGIVKQSGGHIEVESEPGEGSTFHVYLPARRDAVPDRPGVSSTPPGLRGSETILVVEDEAVVRRLAAQLLRRYGYRVLEAQDPGDALLVAEQEPGPIHVLLTDVIMPRMRGPELADRITAKRPGTSVVFMSGYAGDELEHLDGTTLVGKPFEPRALVEAIRRTLDEPED